MNVGVLYGKEQKDSDIATGKATTGIEAASLLADIELLLWQRGYNAAEALHILHRDLLVLCGRLQYAEQTGDAEGDKDARATQ